jgi:hypothetical protein
MTPEDKENTAKTPEHIQKLEDGLAKLGLPPLGAPGKGKTHEIMALMWPEDPFRKIFLAGVAENTAKYEAVPMTITLEEWMGFKEKSDKGLDPLIGKFLQANPDYFAPNRAEGDGITPRTFDGVSDLLTRSKTPNDSGYVVQKFLLDAFLTTKVADELLSFAKDQGFNVSTTHDFNKKLDTDSSLKM